MANQAAKRIFNVFMGDSKIKRAPVEGSPQGLDFAQSGQGLLALNGVKVSRHSTQKAGAEHHDLTGWGGLKAWEHQGVKRHAHAILSRNITDDFEGLLSGGSTEFEGRLFSGTPEGLRNAVKGGNGGWIFKGIANLDYFADIFDKSIRQL